MRKIRCWSLLIGSQRVGHGPSFRKAHEQLIQRLTAGHFPNGYTILAAQGGWYDPARRRFIREATRQVLVTASSVARVRAWARALGRALRQKETLLVELGPARIIPT